MAVNLIQKVTEWINTTLKTSLNFDEQEQSLLEQFDPGDGTVNKEDSVICLTQFVKSNDVFMSKLDEAFIKAG